VVPSASEALPPMMALSSFSIIFCRRRITIAACSSSKPCAALRASYVIWSSSPSVT
jgi:hypothetical protein